MTHYAFEKLKVWQHARELVKLVYHITDGYPVEEKYGLARQLRRSAVSICSNIAEGSTRKSRKDKARFYEVAYGSLIELLNQLIISNDLNLVTEEHLIKGRNSIDEIGRMLGALHKSTFAS